MNREFFVHPTSTVLYRKYYIKKNYGGVFVWGTIILEWMVDTWVLKEMLIHPQRTKYSSLILQEVLSMEKMKPSEVVVYCKDLQAIEFFKKNQIITQ